VNRPLPQTALTQPTHFSARDFRDALGMFATGVTIVTARAADGQLVGLTANSFNSVSIQPPLVLWSLAHTASSMAVFSQVSHYAIHVLAVEQRSLAERFAQRGVDRFAGVSYQSGQFGAPILEGAAAVFECSNRSQYVEGDHTIFVGQVEHCSRSSQASPLVYHGGQFYTEHPLGAIDRTALQE
jgi:flavin reductase (DIM6/NTAB) family NADH-FMN oxidoreductase RutF